MEQQDTYIPNEGKTLEELCQDINLRAEKAYLSIGKGYRKSVLNDVVAILGMLGLNWYFNWHIGAIVTAAVVGWFFIIHLVNKLLVNRMKRATSPKQHLRLAKCLKLWNKLSRAIMVLIVFPWPTWAILDNGAKVSMTLLLTGVFFVLVFITTPIDSDFNEGLAELEYRLEE